MTTKKYTLKELLELVESDENAIWFESRESHVDQPSADQLKSIIKDFLEWNFKS